MSSSSSSLYLIIKFCLIFSTLLILSSSSKCTDHPQCFRKSLFNFNFPQMNLFPISGTISNNKSHQIKAYGDFDNNLYTDYIAINQQGEIQIFVWNQTEYLFQSKYKTKDIKNVCKVETVYLYDVNQDGWLDFTIWGVMDKTVENYNCLVPFLRLPDQEDYLFQKELTYKVQKSSHPILIANKFIGEHQTIGLLLYHNGSRAFLKYNNLSTLIQQFIFLQQNQLINSKSIQWNDLTKNGQHFQTKKFTQPHWNIFMDLTGDCLPDMLLYNQDKHLELWVNQGRKYAFSKIFDDLGSDLKGFSISDINYDGTGDLVLAFDSEIRIHLNKAFLTSQSQFCSSSNRIFSIDLNPISIKMPLSQHIKPQSLHFGDIDINGYPDLLFILTNQNNKDTPVIYQNKFENEKTFEPFQSPNYNQPLNENVGTLEILSVSFIDILENGYIYYFYYYIIVVTKEDNKIQTSMFYNNFLCQNDYYIKGYGMIGPQIGRGTQYPAMSFYWINSVKDGFRVTYQSQMIQTSYDALHMPYTFNGLGRANNYVESFTIGRNGLSKCWSPIIPNSQLGVYTTNANSEDWEIRIFAFPVSQLISVVIVTMFVLSIFGILLMIMKCKTYQKKEEPLMMQLNQ